MRFFNSMKCMSREGLRDTFADGLRPSAYGTLCQIMKNYYIIRVK